MGGATTCCMRGSKFGFDHLAESFLANDERFDVDGAREFARILQKHVNKKLPGSYAWHVFLSEVWADVDEEVELTEEEFIEIVEGQMEPAMTEYYESF